jgi:hypothetical protein
VSRLFVTAAIVGVAVLSIFVQPIGQSADGAEREDVRFRPVDIVIDSDQPIAAYELEVVVARGNAIITGVEGGSAPMNEPPYYDPAALQAGRIIIAAFSTEDTLTGGAHRVATIHFRESGSQPHYEVRVRVIAGPDGDRLNATATAKVRSE